MKEKKKKTNRKKKKKKRSPRAERGYPAADCGEEAPGVL